MLSERHSVSASSTPCDAPAAREWLIPPRWLDRAVEVLVVGAGGTGSHVVAELAALNQTLLDLGHPEGLSVVVLDADEVSDANVLRSRYLPCDVGSYKATTIVQRVNAATGARFRASVGRLSEDAYQISQSVDLVIGCVDTREARREILRQCQAAANRWGRPVLWLDAGNDATTGQVVLGEVRPTEEAHSGPASRSSPRLAARLPCVTDLFPGLLDPAQDPLDPGPSCSRAEALSRQSLAVNRAAAFHALCLLVEAFTAGRLTTHGIFFDVAAGRATPLAIDREAWAAFGYAPSA